MTLNITTDMEPIRNRIEEIRVNIITRCISPEGTHHALSDLMEDLPELIRQCITVTEEGP